MLSVFCLVFSMFVFCADASLAAGLVPAPKDGKAGNYELSDFTQIGILVANMILGLVGSLSLGVFIYGGFMMLISGGESGKIESGKKAISAAIVGLIIVFTSYMIITFTVKTLQNNQKADINKPDTIIK